MWSPTYSSQSMYRHTCYCSQGFMNNLWQPWIISFCISLAYQSIAKALCYSPRGGNFPPIQDLTTRLLLWKQRDFLYLHRMWQIMLKLLIAGQVCNKYYNYPPHGKHMSQTHRHVPGPDTQHLQLEVQGSRERGHARSLEHRCAHGCSIAWPARDTARPQRSREVTDNTVAHIHVILSARDSGTRASWQHTQLHVYAYAYVYVQGSAVTVAIYLARHVYTSWALRKGHLCMGEQAI